MKVRATEAAEELIQRVRDGRRGELVITIGTGCCESTAPFLYEDFWPGPDQEQVGDAGGVPVYAPEYLRALYGDDEALLIDVNSDDLAESMSIETEYGQRLTLRRPGDATTVERGPETACETNVTREVVGQLPEALRNVKLR